MTTDSREQRFDVGLLQNLLAEAEVDLLLLTSAHNVQYLLGGYRPFFFEGDETLGLSRRVPVIGYPTERPDAAFYVGHMLERDQIVFEPLWIRNIELTAWSAAAIAEPCARQIRALGLERGTIAFEGAFMPTESYLVLGELLPEVRLIDKAGGIMEDLRMIKQPHELTLIREACERIVDSMVATLERARAGITTAELEEIMRVEEAARGLRFDYCLTTTGADGNRAPSRSRRWEPGSALSLDSGGRLDGYIGDIARMAVLGEPSMLQRELLDEVDAIQQAARGAVRPGVAGIEIYTAVEQQLDASPHWELVHFIGEGIGLIGHEAPRIGTSPLPDSGEDTNRPLECGMVLSIETSVNHPEVGLVKLEDQIIVVPDGYEAAGDGARGWNVVT